MSFKSKLLSHIDHTAFAGVNAIQSIDLSNNSLMFVGQAFNPYYYYLVHSPASYVFNGYCNACGITCATSCSGTTCSKTCQGYISNAQCSPTISNCYNVATDYQTCSSGTYLNSLLTINLSNNKISHIDVAAFCNLRKLRILSLAHNELTQISPQIFDSLFNLEELELSFNRLTQIESNTFQNLSNLKRLDLQNNQLNSIDSSLFIIQRTSQVFH